MATLQEVCRRQFKHNQLSEWPPINDVSLLRFQISDHKLILLQIDQRAVTFSEGLFKNCWYVNKPMYGEGVDPGFLVGGLVATGLNVGSIFLVEGQLLWLEQLVVRCGGLHPPRSVPDRIRDCRCR